MGKGILIPWCYHSPTTSGWKRMPSATPRGLCLLRWQEWTATPMGHSVRQKKKKGNRKIMHVNMLPRDGKTYLSLTVASMTPSLTLLKRKVFSQWAVSMRVCIRVATICVCNTGPAQIRLRQRAHVPLWIRNWSKPPCHNKCTVPHIHSHRGTISQIMTVHH